MGEIASAEGALEHRNTSVTLNPEERNDTGEMEVASQNGGQQGPSGGAGGASLPLFVTGVMIRGHKGDLARFFELPPSESLRGDFHCALRKRVLLQGRMYVFDHYVCFYSAVFGFAKKRRIPMRTINSVKKKTHLGFPNSLEIDAEERKDFFTSFLSREEAFQLIMKLLPDAKRMCEDDSVTARRSTDTGSGVGGPREMASPPQRGAGGEHGVRGGRAGGDRSLMTRNSGSMVDEGDDEEEEEAGVWTVEPRSAPPVIAGSRHVLHSALPGSPRDFFETVLADNAPFFEDFLDSQGNRRINLTTWKRHPQLGHVRDLQFTAPIKGAFGNWGVSHTACFQSHRFCLYSDDHIVFESSQTMTDIPYGDCFTVDQRWDVKRDLAADPDKPQVTFDLHVRVPFTSRCLFKGVIESGSYKQVQDTFAQFIDQLRPVMTERFVTRNTLNIRDPDGGTSAGGGGGGTAQTPRVGSAPRNASMARGATLQHTPSLRTSQTMPRNNAMHSPQAFDAVEASPHGDGLANGSALGLGAEGGGRGHGEPGVGRLLLSLGGRLADGARGMLERGIDVVLNLTQCQCTPQMRFLVAVVILMFLANLTCMLTSMWPLGGSLPSASPAPRLLVQQSSVGAPGAESGFGLPQDLLHAAGAAAAAGGGGGAAAGGLGDGGLGGSYWLQRLGVLQQELQLLQGRLEFVTREVNVVMSHLAQAGAAAAAAAAGAPGGEGATATAAAGGPVGQEL
ncbi:hypothetical protein CHLRE_16g664050v5 [Chlamydomonas reinhardtii]|uniref:VASt domain-containing protein n=1 Tax=Chlamydomonas reinhardtii TaxID=3055 RepID=A0A2K3CTT1_CHLRE|nr:uncharacterized protein CHLRE_16g664050v5 [Chlamydomonas reinhardtii]PNW71671.1 hypothetical protein CHLRE_16g664050v5 [Chlamydomonas reinhardtii]